MKTKIFLLNIILFFFVGCNYGINDKTTQISYINNTCFEEHAWDSIIADYPTSRIKDSLFLQALTDFKNVSFPVSVIYFEQEPRELIGFDYSSLRYVFNPALSRQILDGLSPELKEKEKKRIRNRVQTVIMKYQCEDGKKQSLELMQK
jgi:hypothetical protein